MFFLSRKIWHCLPLLALTFPAYAGDVRYDRNIEKAAARKAVHSLGALRGTIPVIARDAFHQTGRSLPPRPGFPIIREQSRENTDGLPPIVMITPTDIASTGL